MHVLFENCLQITGSPWSKAVDLTVEVNIWRMYHLTTYSASIDSVCDFRISFFFFQSFTAYLHIGNFPLFSE